MVNYHVRQAKYRFLKNRCRSFEFSLLVSKYIKISLPCLGDFVHNPSELKSEFVGLSEYSFVCPVKILSLLESNISDNLKPP